MVDGMTFKESLENEKMKWAVMNRAQKWDYFKAYYMLPTIIVVAVLTLVVSYIFTYIRNSRDTVAGIYFLNVVADQSFYDKVEGEYFDYVGANEKDYMTDVSTENLLELTESGYDSTAYATDMQVVAMLTAASLDFMFLDDTTLERYSNYGCYANLEELLTEEEYEALAPYIVEVTDEDGNTTPAAICLTGTELQEKYSIYSCYGENPYLVVLVNGKNYENALTFIDYLFFEE